MQSAFFMGKMNDITGEPLWNNAPLYDLSQFNLIVCGIECDPIAIKEVAKDAKLIAYIPSRFTANWDKQNPMHQNWRKSFAEDNYLHDANGNRISVTWEKTDELFYSHNTALRYAIFIHSYFRTQQGWDGVYFDDWGENLAPCMYRSTGCHSGTVGLPFPPLFAQSIWDNYRKTLVETLRNLLSYDGLIICNSGAYSRTPYGEIDGICMEEWWPNGQSNFLEECKKFNPENCVTWEWSSPDSIARDGIIRYRPFRQ